MFQTFAAFVFDDGASLLEGDRRRSPPGNWSPARMNHFNFPGILSRQRRRRQTACRRWQKARHWHPITFATDPRHLLQQPGISVRGQIFAMAGRLPGRHWRPGPKNLPTLPDKSISPLASAAIHPMADLATELRGINGTFGEDARRPPDRRLYPGLSGRRLGPQSYLHDQTLPGGGLKDGEIFSLWQRASLPR